MLNTAGSICAPENNCRVEGLEIALTFPNGWMKIDAMAMSKIRATKVALKCFLKIFSPRIFSGHRAVSINSARIRRTSA